MNPCRPLLFRSFLLLLLPFTTLGQMNVWTYHYNNARTGLNTNETILRPANVNSTNFGKLLTYSVDGYVYAQPLYVSALNMPGRGVHNVVFLATQHNSVYAFDADIGTAPLGGLLWQTNFGPSAATPNNDFGNRYGAYGDINPEIGITGTPVIDLSSGTLYVDAFTHEGSSYFHRLHALNIADGTEQPYSPVLVNVSIPGTGVGGNGTNVTFNPEQQLQRSALTLAAGVVYVNYAGYADTDPYHGWIIGYRASDLQQLPDHIFNTTPNSTTAAYGANAGEGGIWMAGGGLSVDDDTNLYFETANGVFNATNNSGGTEYGDSFLKLTTTGGLAVADYFTPNNQKYLADHDLDLGSGGLLLLPDQPGPYPHLLVGAGKEGKIYLINRDMMTTNDNHYNASGSTDYVRQILTAGLAGGSFDTPAYFNQAVYYVASGDRMKSFSLSGGLLSTAPTSTGPRTFAFPGANPTVSANGTSNGIVWALQDATPAVLAAYNASNVSTEIYNSSQAAGNRDQLAAGVKFTVPVVANGKVFVGAQGSASVFGLRDPYLYWKYQCFGQDATNPAVAQDLADPDGDGAVNLLEYALVTDPTTPDSGSSLNAVVVGDQLEVLFRRNILATNLTYIVQAADALGEPWTDLMTYSSGSGWVANTAGATASESLPDMIGLDRFVTAAVTDPAPVAETTNRFFRLAVHN